MAAAVAAAAAAAGAPPLPGDDSSVCWICLEGGSLTKPCKCACMRAHQLCLAAWQLAKAGTRDEVQCRFCLSALPPWKPVLRDSLDKVAPSSALPVVAVVYGGKEYRLTVQATPEGLRRFGKQVELITGEPFSDAMDVRFFCKSPTGYNLELHGVHSLEAAMTCAAVTAAERGLLEPPPHTTASAESEAKGTHAAAGNTQASEINGEIEAGGPAAAAAAEAAGEEEEWDATATILQARPARRMPPIDIVEYWRQQQLSRLPQVPEASAAADGGDGDATACSTRCGQEGPTGASEQQREAGGDGAAACLPLRLSGMMKRLVPSW